MEKSSVRTAEVERRFGEEEILVSKTDLKGHIRYFNDVFLRVSAYSHDELMGAAHNLIRHPEVPGGIFELLWRSIQSGEEIFAYLNNLAKDHHHYWVFAHVTPTFDTKGSIVGYHSNRRAPNRTALPTVTALYREMREQERGLPGPKAAKKSLAWFESYLADRGQTYSEFVWSLESAPTSETARPRELSHV